MKGISLIFDGTGAALYLCLGAIPDKVIVRNVEATNGYWAEWNKNWRAAEQIDGIMLGTAAGVTITVQTTGQGIQPYVGGDVMTSDNQTGLTYATAIYIREDECKDYRIAGASPTDIASGGSTIDTWTLVSGVTGHFNEDVVGSYIGEGSEIQIDGVVYVIASVSAGQGESTTEVTLNRAAPSGKIERIGPMYDMKAVPLGETTSAGIKVNNTTLNVDENLMLVEAYWFDN
jgi:hypothetical protein